MLRVLANLLKLAHCELKCRPRIGDLELARRSSHCLARPLSSLTNFPSFFTIFLVLSTTSSAPEHCSIVSLLGARRVKFSQVASYSHRVGSLPVQQTPSTINDDVLAVHVGVASD